MYLLVYVDDLILTGNQPNVLTKFIKRLNKEFAIKGLGELNYFLGLEVTYTTNGIFLNQSKYAKKIQTRSNMIDAKPAPTLLGANVSIVSIRDSFPDLTHYCSIVGALQYLIITRPDISYVVNQVSPSLHAPTISSLLVDSKKKYVVPFISKENTELEKQFDRRSSMRAFILSTTESVTFSS
ncbi:uncharacterized mitochondrial protein-like protein [Tanacetum coccineum]